MGNTTRRQPISTRIPASPDYRFLNITDFKGLDISDNPFILKPNTASDLLNVYVDENNALSTRPRLEKLYDAKQVIADGELIGVYNISNGYLIHVRDVEADSGALYKYTDSLYELYGASIPTDKCLVYEKGDKIYLLDGTNQYVIDGSQISYVSPYVPTIRQASLENRTGGSYEQINILSNEYKETYFWDNISKIPYTDTDDVIDVDNVEYIQQTIDLRDNEYKILCVKNNTVLAVSPNGYYSVGVFDDDMSHITFTTSQFKYDETTKHMACATNALSVFEFSSTTTKNYTINIANEIVMTDFNFTYDGSFDLLGSVWCSSDGDCAFVAWKTPAGYGLMDCFSVKKKKMAQGTKSWIFGETTAADIVGDNLYVGSNLARVRVVENFYEKYDDDLSVSYYDGVFLTQFVNPTVSSIVSCDDGVYVSSANGEGVYVEFDTEGKAAKILYNKTENISYTRSVGDGVIGYMTDKNCVCVVNVVNDVVRTARFGIKTKIDGGAHGYLKFGYDSKTDNFLINVGVDEYETFRKKNSTAAGLILLKEIDGETRKKQEQWREKFLKSKLTSRFENNWWFASENTLFRTENNDPTYIPLDEEMEVGDTKDVITGFNLAQDDLLIVYKKNKIFAIQPAEVYDRLTYTILETKNVSGNNAFGSAIVTTLTETPVHISYDGIFALNQLKNVQSSDRVAMLISDKINKKWLKESKSAIDNCKTINRLYWTYFVLIYKDLTKIYLLDNRTQSWFYWELPIETLDVFVKDETATFVDVNGKIYKLTTDDIINEYNKDVTEYYDDDKKLIKWYWKSQILPLGTINYSKKLVDTTFIVADTDASDEYALNYKFRAYRKMVSESNETTISNRLNYVQSTTKKTLIPRFNFLQTEIYNVEDDLNNNKLRLLGLGLKYVLLEGLL